MRRLALVLVMLSITAFAACSGDGDKPPAGGETPKASRTAEPDGGNGDGGGGDLSGREAELRDSVQSLYTSLLAGGAVESYRLASENFKEKCSLGDFTGVAGLIRIFLGEIDRDAVEVEVTDIRYEDDRAYATAAITLEGNRFGEEETDDALADFWVYEDGGWKFDTEEEEPCANGGLSTSSGDSTPVSGPGASRAEPVPLGESVDAGDLRVTVLEADIDAAARLSDVSDFPQTPEPGRHAVLVRIRAENIATDGDETIELYDSSFQITGSKNIIYDGFDDSSCSFSLRDRAAGEMFPGGKIEGYVCLLVPADETDLLLVFEPGFGFEENARRFLALE